MCLKLQKKLVSEFSSYRFEMEGLWVQGKRRSDMVYKIPCDDPASIWLSSGWQSPGNFYADLPSLQYEVIRRFLADFNRLLTEVEDECSCAAMIATEEWHFLCAAHRKPQECSAFDYMRHTVDGSIALVLSTRNFSDRKKIDPENAKMFVSMLRRLYRIFAHLFFHHRELFLRYEESNNFCQKFTAFVKEFSLVTDDTLIIPSDAF